MKIVSVRDLRNHGGDVLTRVETGERIVVTRSVPAAQLIARHRGLPSIDFESFRADLDDAAVALSADLPVYTANPAGVAGIRGLTVREIERPLR